MICAHDFYRPAGFHFLKGGAGFSSGKLIAPGRITSSVSVRTERDSQTRRIFRRTNFRPRSSPNTFSFQATLMPIRHPNGSDARTPRSNAFSFVFQSFIDELAHAGGRDPLDFRLELLNAARVANAAGPNPGEPDIEAARMIDVLKLVAEKSDWSSRKQLPKGRAKGIASIRAPRLFCGSGGPQRGCK